MGALTGSRGRLAATFAALFLAALSAGVPAAPADDLREAQKLHRQGRHDAALARVDALLSAQPRDPGARFLRGVVLAETKRADEAIAVFTALTNEFPELPEPYNNLAVLYADKGQYEKAKAVLELAIAAHPGYAIAHENLGDVLARLAAREYERALQIDKNNSGARLKLEKSREILAPR